MPIRVVAMKLDWKLYLATRYRLVPRVRRVKATERNMHSSHLHSSGATTDLPKKAPTESRIATSTTMIALLLLIGSAHVMRLAVAGPRQSQEQSNAVQPKAARIVDPAFCENQTWPYIDARCLKRVEPTPTTKVQDASSSSEPAPRPPKAIPSQVAPATAHDIRQDMRPDISGASNDPSATPLAKATPAAMPSDARRATQQEANTASGDSLAHASSEPNAARAGAPEQFWGQPVATNAVEADSNSRYQHSRHRYRHYRAFGFRF